MRAGWNAPQELGSRRGFNLHGSEKPQQGNQAQGRFGDHGLSGEEKATRKRRLIKGPREFRDVRAVTSQKTKAEAHALTNKCAARLIAFG
jgi:hypothetical protein